MLESMAYDKNFWSYDPECRSIHSNMEFSLLPLWSKLVSATVLYFRPCFPVEATCKQLNFIKHQDCSAIAIACMYYSHYLLSFSLSAKAPADILIGLKRVNESILVLNQVNQLQSRLTNFKAGSWL